MKLVFTALIFLFMFTNVYSQNVPITGKVTDTIDGSVLIGATIKIKGTSKATVTDNAGNFRIMASKNETLVISNVGYADQEINIGNQTAINVSMSRQENSISEVVVTA